MTLCLIQKNLVMTRKYYIEFQHILQSALRNIKLPDIEKPYTLKRADYDLAYMINPNIH